MSSIRAQVIMKAASSISADYTTNSWCIETTDPPNDSEFDEYTVALKDFYDDLAGMFSTAVAQNGHEVKYYDLEWTTPPNYPLYIDGFNLASAPSVAGLPHEVALCMSFQGEKVPGFPQRRRRGRVYIGPLSASMNNAGRPTSGAISTLATAGATLCANLKACSNVAQLSVWSHVDSAAVPVADGWVDDAFDTQRRRGVAPTSRTTFVG